MSTDTDPLPINGLKPGIIVRTARCEKCKWADPETGSRNFFCRRNPPVGIPVMTQKGILPMTVWPIVQGQQWCGAFEKPRSILGAN